MNPPVPGAPGAVLFRDASVLDGSGTPPFRATVRVEGPRITAISPTGAELVPGGAAVIECRGATLMPGLIEPHAHLSFVDQATPFAFTTIPVEEHVLLTLKHAKLYLDQGFTSCFSAAATKPIGAPNRSEPRRDQRVGRSR